jgi:hypothetical protein
VQRDRDLLIGQLMAGESLGRCFGDEKMVGLRLQKEISWRLLI